MNLRRSRTARRVQRLVDDLPMHQSDDLETLFSQVAERRGRSVTLVETSMPPGMSGAWIATTERDIVVCERDTTQLHREHILLHELGHMLCGHRPHEVGGAQLLTLLSGGMPLLGADTVAHMLARSRPDSPAEAEAESFAWHAQRAIAAAREHVSARQPVDRLALAIRGSQPALRW